MKLIIAEKPSLGRSIADAIPGEASGKDPIYKGDYCITWLYGHILCLQEPQDYDPAYQKWSIEQLPIYFENWKQKPADGKESRLSQIGSLLEQAELVIHAGDPDDEGQLLVDEVLRWFHYSGSVLRLDTANTTKAALKRALNNMQENASRENDGWSAYARSVADMMIGVNMSRFFTCMNRGKTLSVGRVQTPALGLVVARDQLIENHQKTTYYNISGELEIDAKRIPYTLQLDKNDPRLTDGRLLDRNIAAALRDRLNGRKLTGIQIHSRAEAEQPPLPFNLVKLQTYCGNAWGYDPQKVMNITQKLKDSGAITYNRSDCQYLSSDHFKEAPKTVPTVCRNLSLDTGMLDTSIRSAAFNDANITAHFAIIPTDSTRDLSRFTQEERNVYTIIAKYYLAQFLPPCIRRKTTLKKEIPDVGTVTSVSSEITDKGFHRLLPSKSEPATPLSGFSDGMYAGNILDAQVREVETKPPARYTKTSLNEDMTRIAKYVEDAHVKKLLLEKDKDKKGENGSIGTSATRASIIDGLILRGFLTEKNRKLISTDMGREFYHVLPDEIKKPDMTAYWWVLQEQIKSGEVTYEKLCSSVLDTINRILPQKFPLLNSAAKIPADRKIVGRCPRCGGYVVSGSKGFGCINYRNGCRFTLWKTSKNSLLKNITITDRMAEALLSGDTIATKKLYSASKQTSFFGGLKLKDEGGDYGAGLEFVPIERTPIGKCPLCGGDILETRLSFSCSQYQSGCKFAIWKHPKGSVWKNITISEAAAKKLLKGETVTTKKLWSEKKQSTFYGGYCLKAFSPEVSAAEASDGADEILADRKQSYRLELVMLERPSIGTCPRCGGAVIEGKNGFGCSNYKSGCKFVIWKKAKSGYLQELTITETMAKKLLAGEKLQVTRLKKKGIERPLSGTVLLEDQGSEYGAEYQISFDPLPEIGTCPRCGRPVTETAQSFCCSGWKEGCRFEIWKKAKSGLFADVVITEELARDLLGGKQIQTDLLYSSKKDTHFSGSFILKDQGSDYGAGFELIPYSDQNIETDMQKTQETSYTAAEEGPDDFHHLFEHLYDDE